MSRCIGGKAARFGASGIVATVVHVVVAALSIELAKLEQSTANALAFVVATVCSYWLNTLWSFASEINRKTASRFLVVAGLGLTWSFLIGSVADLLHWHYLIGIGIIVLTLPPMTFFLHLGWTYGSGRQSGIQGPQ